MNACCPMFRTAAWTSWWGTRSSAAPTTRSCWRTSPARMALRGAGIAPGPLVTGVIAAVRGTSAANGEFFVKVRIPCLPLPPG